MSAASRRVEAPEAGGNATGAQRIDGGGGTDGRGGEGVRVDGGRLAEAYRVDGGDGARVDGADRARVDGRSAGATATEARAGGATQARAGGGPASIGDLLGELSRDVSRLVRQEVELAKAELRRDAKKTGRAGGMFGAGAVAALMTLLYLSLAAWRALSHAIDTGWAALVVAAIFGIATAVLFSAGRGQLRNLNGLRRTAETVREAPGALKPNPDHRKEGS